MYAELEIAMSDLSNIRNYEKEFQRWMDDNNEIASIIAGYTLPNYGNENVVGIQKANIPAMIEEIKDVIKEQIKNDNV